MTAAPGLAAIPWRFVDTELARTWVWETEHFEATISADLNSFTWEVADRVTLTQGLPTFLREGRCADFVTAEQDVRETVGKCYSPRLGYGPYVGAFATTFTIADGTSINLGEYDGNLVQATVRLPNGATQTVRGYAHVTHWELHITRHNHETVRIQPAHLTAITKESGTRTIPDTYTGVGRIYRGKVTRSCTGKPGFLPNTIEHNGGVCPIHEARLRQ